MPSSLRAFAAVLVLLLSLFATFFLLDLRRVPLHEVHAAVLP